MKDRALDSRLICIGQNERDSADLESAPLRVALITATTAGRRRTRIDNFGFRSSLRDFGTATDRGSDFIFLLTSFFNDSIHQLVATKDGCKFSMKNGRENRTNGNEKEGEKEKEALRKFSTKSDRGRKLRPLSFLYENFRLSWTSPHSPADSE